MKGERINSSENRMAIRELTDIREEAVFGRRLFLLGEEEGLRGPAAVAGALYANDECYKLIQPGKRESKYSVNKDKDTSAIARRVQEHFDKESPCDVPGNYMLAYGILFNCSMDYLYGRISDKCPDATVDDMSKKTGLSSKAITKLMSNREVCVEEYLETVSNYGLLDGLPENSDTDDEYYETYYSVSDFWSGLIESDLFCNLPEDWYRMACALYTDKAIKIVAEDAKLAWDEVPSWEVFSSWVDTWNTFHEDEPLYIPEGMSIKEAYEADSEWVKQVYREIRYNHLYSAVDRAENTETVYWGCAGKFDRNLQNYFHEIAERWCDEGPLPKVGK